MTLPLYDIAGEFADLLPEERLELLIDFSRELPEPSGRHGLIAGNETCRVQECQTPVYLWVGVEDGKTAIEADVPEKSPTVRGLVSVIAAGISGGDPQEVLDLPDDLLPILGLQETLGMTRQAGVRGMLVRIKRDLRVALAK